jgi:NAD(P)H-hydrate epimerase
VNLPVGTGLPSITTDQMREVDRVMVEDLHVELPQMMENAGRNLALLATLRFAPGTVTVLAGPGGNGGGGLAAARHLANRGIDTTVVLHRERLAAAPSHQADIVRRMGIAIEADPPTADLVIDAVLGYGVSGDPRGRAAELIAWANAQDSPILSLDGPSGLDLTTGAAGTPTAEATATMTLALPKQGLEARPDLVGELYLADISVPPDVYRAFGIDLEDPFSEAPIVRLA